MNWENIKARFGEDRFNAKLQAANFIGFVNWTMLTSMNDTFAEILSEVCLKLTGPRRKIFFDLADPEKRARRHPQGALAHHRVRETLRCDPRPGTKRKPTKSAAISIDTKGSFAGRFVQADPEIHARIKINTVVVHPVSYALAVSANDAAIVEGPFTPKPLITTGAGDHFNAGSVSASCSV